AGQRGAPAECTARRPGRLRLEALFETDAEGARRTYHRQRLPAADWRAPQLNGAFREAVHLRAPVEHVVGEDLRSEVASGDAGQDIEQSVSRLSADQQVVVRHELGTGRALVVEGALHMGLDLAAQREGVPRGEVPLELRDDRQLRVTGGRVGRRTSRGHERRWARERQRLATGVDIETEVLGELGIELGRSQAEGESLDGSPFQLLLRALDARRACVADDREGVLTQEPELEVLPVLPEEC